MDILKLIEAFSYDPESGILFYRGSGRIASNKDDRGYIRVSYHGKILKAHRVAWAIYHGIMPCLDIDHINGVKSDNRIGNLREVSHRQNQQNRRSAQSNNLCGFLGVQKRGNRYRATIKSGGKNITLGTFNSPEEAHDAYLKSKRELHLGCSI